VGLVLAGAGAVIFARSVWGFRLKAVGAGPRAAWMIGRIPSAKVLAAALLISGGIAGLGGAIEVGGVTHALFQNLSPGYGFTAIAVALLARGNPIGIVGTGLLFGALEAGASAMQREAGIPSVAVSIVQATVIIVILLGEVASRRRQGATHVPEVVEVE
jgi:simple sugar transport system permease protein